MATIGDAYEAGMSAEPIYWGNSWWWFRNINTNVEWFVGHHEPFPSTVDIEAIEHRTGAKKKFRIPIYARFLHLDYGWQPYEGPKVKQFHIVMYREAENTSESALKRLDNNEYKSESEATRAAEDNSSRYPGRSYYVFTAVSRTKTNNTITERLCPC